MYQLIFRHYGSDEVNGSVQICIEQDLNKAKTLVHSWMLSYVEYVRKCTFNEIDENNKLTLEEKFFNEYTFGGTNDIAEILLYKLKTMKDLEKAFKKNETEEDFTILQSELFDPILKLTYSETNGIIEHK